MYNFIIMNTFLLSTQIYVFAGVWSHVPLKYFCRTNGTVVSMGKGVDTPVATPDGYTLNYNEYIVYDTRQIRMKYLIKVRFNFKWGTSVTSERFRQWF